MRLRVSLFASVLASIASLAAAAACGPADYYSSGDTPDSGSPNGYGSGYGSGSGSGYGSSSGYGGSSGSGGDGYDAGAPEAAADAGPAAPPPIPATPQASAPAICPDGAMPTAYLAAEDGTLFSFDPTALDMRSLGILACEPDQIVWSLAASPSGTLYALYYEGKLFQVDPTTLACTPTAFSSGQLGYSWGPSVTLGAGTSGDRLFALGGNAATTGLTLGVSDLASYRLFSIGAVTPTSPGSVAIHEDAWGRLFALGMDGSLLQLDPATAGVVGADHTGFDGAGGAIIVSGTLAVMAYGDQLYFIGGPSGSISRYDVSTKDLRPLGTLNQGIVAATAAPCVAAPAASDDGGSAEAGVQDEGGAAADAGPVPIATPFAPGDVWIGTYVCPQGLTDVALAIDSIDDQGGVHARFDFDWAGDNTSGSFAIDGTYDPATREATFTPGAWVSQPASSWQTVGLDGYVDLSGTRLAGNVTHDGCGAFAVQR